MSDFDTEKEIAALREQTRRIRRRGYRVSRLDRYTAELLSLYHGGATAAQIQRWLLQKKRTKVVLSTVTRWLARHD